MVLHMDICLEGQEGPPDKGEESTALDQRRNYEQLMGSLDQLARQNEEQNNSRLLYRIARFYAHHLTNLNRIDCKAPASERERVGLIRRFLWVREYGLWSNLLFVCSLISLAHLIYATYAHYCVDLPQSRMERLILMMRAQFAHATASREQTQTQQIQQQGTFLSWDHLRLLRELNETVAQRRGELERVGSPSGHLRFAIENIYVGHILFAIFSYISPCIYIKWLAHKDQYVLMCLDDYKQELVACGRLASQVVRDYQISARNFVRVAHQRLGSRCIFQRADQQQQQQQQSLRVTSARQQQAGSEGTPSAVLERERQLALHLNRHLASLHLDGQLVPFNRRPEWVAKWARQLLVAITGGLGGYILKDTYVLGTLYMHSRATISHLSWPDLMVLLDIAIMSLCIDVSTIFYANLFVITVWDQTRLSNKLLTLMTDYLVDTCQRFHKHLIMERHHHQRASTQKMRASNCWQHQNRSNSDLLELLIHYKLFVRQLVPLHERLSYSLMTCISILFILPITSRIHVPYYQMPPEIDYTVRTFIMVLSLVVGVPACLLAFPACHMHARCLKLQQMLNNLTAHVAYVQSQPEFRFFYDEHLVSILRRESTIERGHHRDLFAISFGSHLQFDYSTVLQIYLWFGFILISLSFSGQRTLDALRAFQQQVLAEGGPTPGRAKPFVNVLDDPLGLFSV